MANGALLENFLLGHTNADDGTSRVRELEVVALSDRDEGIGELGMILEVADNEVPNQDKGNAEVG